MLSCFCAYGDAITIAEPLLALMLLNSARGFGDQLVSILAASVTLMLEDSMSLFSNLSQLSQLSSEYEKKDEDGSDSTDDAPK